MAETATNTTTTQDAGQTSDAQQTTSASTNTADTPQSTPSANAGDDLDRRIQSAIDRATQKLGTENKALRTEIQRLKTANMTEAEKHESDLAEREKDLRERETALRIEKNRMHALTALKNAGLDDGSTAVVDLIDLVMGEDDKAIDTKVTALQTLVKKMVAAKVETTFKNQGRDPGKGNASPDESKNQFITELGKRTAETSKKSRSVLDLYTGGKKA